MSQTPPTAPANFITKQGVAPTPANVLSLDYRAEADRLGTPPAPIVDGHAHINGKRASAIHRQVMDLYNIDVVISQTLIEDAPAVRQNLGDRIRFVALPRYQAADKQYAFTQGYLDDLDIWAGEYGARMLKHWNAPRLRDFVEGFAPVGSDAFNAFVPFDSDWRLRVSEKAISLGMMLMVHVADPNTWFETKYADADRYGTKEQQYDSLHRLMERFPDTPLLAAHMGGSPEDLKFLSALLDEHPQMIVDTSATKWIVRELSKHDQQELVDFLSKYEGRILYGSDIVTSDDHLRTDSDDAKFASALAGTEDEAFELYASRYWAQRVMWEQRYVGPSNIADPDLMMCAPAKYTELSSPQLTGRALPQSMLKPLYRGAAERTILKWYADHS